MFRWLGFSAETMETDKVGTKGLLRCARKQGKKVLLQVLRHGDEIRLRVGKSFLALEGFQAR